ncbi:ROK family transcriptional regulator [Okibacterium endophyticum]
MNTRGNNLDTVRRHNLSMILGLVHRHGALSRSDLTRETGLNRSTVAALVAELAALRLVVEAGPDASRGVGRPSPVVRPHPDLVAFAVNPEVDAVTVGVVRLNGVVVAQLRHEVETPPTVDDTVRITVDLIRRLSETLPAEALVAGIGVAVPGLVRAADGVVRLAPHLGWIDEPLAERLAEATGHSAFAANDASLGAAAEYVFGAGRGVGDLIYLNGGASGIGGGVIANGLPLGGVGGYAGEFGHNLVTARVPAAGAGASDAAPGVHRAGRPDGGSRVDGTGGDDLTLEDEVNRARLLRVLGRDHADPVALERELLESDDPAVVAEAERQIYVLSIALRNAINVLNPEVVVLGGFLGALAAKNGELLDEFVASQTLAASFEQVRIVRAELGADLLMIAAAELAFEPLLRDPASLRAGTATMGGRL